MGGDEGLEHTIAIHALWAMYDHLACPLAVIHRRSTWYMADLSLGSAIFETKSRQNENRRLFLSLTEGLAIISPSRGGFVKRAY